MTINGGLLERDGEGFEKLESLVVQATSGDVLNVNGATIVVVIVTTVAIMVK